MHTLLWCWSVLSHASRRKRNEPNWECNCNKIHIFTVHLPHWAIGFGGGRALPSTSNAAALAVGVVKQLHSSSGFVLTAWLENIICSHNAHTDNGMQWFQMTCSGLFSHHSSFRSFWKKNIHKPVRFHVFHTAGGWCWSLLYILLYYGSMHLYPLSNIHRP